MLQSPPQRCRAQRADRDDVEEDPPEDEEEDSDEEEEELVVDAPEGEALLLLLLLLFLCFFVCRLEPSSSSPSSSSPWRRLFLSLGSPSSSFLLLCFFLRWCDFLDFLDFFRSSARQHRRAGGCAVKHCHPSTRQAHHSAAEDPRESSPPAPARSAVA